MEYFDLDSIQAEENTIDCKFPYKISFGAVVTGADTIPANKYVRIPIFALKYIYQNGHCSIKSHILTIENDLRADSRKNVLLATDPYFYRVAVFLHADKSLFWNTVYLERMNSFIGQLDTVDLNEMDLDEKRTIKNTILKLKEFNVNL